MIGKKITELRNRKGLTQLRAAKMLQMPRSTYSNYELDKREPDFDTTQKLASFFDISVDELLGVNTKNALIEETELDRKKNKLKNIIDAMNDESELDYTAETINRLLGKK